MDASASEPQRSPSFPGSTPDEGAPALVSGVLAGAVGAIAAAAIAIGGALLGGSTPAHPPRLVAASLMGASALLPEHATPATILGGVLIVILGAAFGALFAWLRRGVRRRGLLFAEGIGFALVLFAATWAALPVLDPVMAAHQPPLVMAVAFVVYGASLAGILKLRRAGGRVNVIRERLEAPRSSRI